MTYVLSNFEISEVFANQVAKIKELEKKIAIIESNKIKYNFPTPGISAVISLITFSNCSWGEKYVYLNKKYI